MKHLFVIHHYHWITYVAIDINFDISRNDGILKTSFDEIHNINLIDIKLVFSGKI